MQLNSDTTLRELFEEKIISARTYNCLRYASMVTLADVKNYADSPAELMKIRNFGRKSYTELMALFKEMNLDKNASEKIFSNTDEDIVELLKTAYDSLFQEDNSITQFMKTAYPSVGELHYIVMGDIDKLLQVRRNFSMQENVELRKLFAQYLYAAITKMVYGQHANHKICVEYQEKYNTLTLKLTDFTYKEKVEYFMSASKSKYFQTEYERLRGGLSVRTRNFLDAFVPSFKQLVLLFDAPLVRYKDLCPGKGMKRTLNEIFEFNKQLRHEFDKCWQQNDEELMMSVLKQKHPYLSSLQRRFVADYYKEYGSYPLFFLLYNYMRISETRNDKIFSLLNGIFDGKERTLNELADIMGLTRERVRQISIKKLDVHDTELMQDPGWSNYETLFSLPFATAETVEYKQIKEREHLGVDFRVFCSLMLLVGARDIKVEAKYEGGKNRILKYSNQYEIFTINDVAVLINRKKMPTVDVLECVESLQKLVSTRYTNDTLISISPAIKDLMWDKFAADYIKMDSEEKEETIKLVARVAAEALDLEVNDNSEVIVRKNYVDVAEELYSILEQKGEPMSIDEMFEVFKQKYPNHKYTESARIKPYLFRHPNIKAIGNTSRYGLDSWEHVFYGSIRDLIIKLLNESEEPLHIEDIYNGVHEHYPDTYLESIQMSMKVDSLGRFVQFNDGYFGLSSKQYDDSYELFNPQWQRTSFEDRIADFCDFVDTYKRYPMVNNGDRESSLYRWLYNIQHGVIVINDEQKEELNNITARYEQEYIPRTGTENEFRSKCDDYKDFINTHYTLPTVTTNSELYSWMLRSKANYDSYVDHRRKYLTDLFNYILSLGFRI